MPNQRAANKRQFGITLTKEEVAKIDAAAKKAGVTRTEFIRRSVGKALKEQSPEKTKQI